ncbi:MAG: pilus assembly protein PilF [Bacteroidota bacterium]|jgi:tetratricopeptide (TPR) repeat protein|nr:pilus assembly protein PilF [Bacteroidota bacterium]
MEAQKDTLALFYRLGHCTPHCDARIILDTLEQKKLNKEQILDIGTYIAYHGNDQCANELMKLCISKNDSITAGNWHTYSVQNTKNGNYAESFQALEKSLAINAKEMEGYYGWVLLYYYRDYERALQHLNHYDSLTPNDVDAPVGENIHFLKGICYYQLGQYQKAIQEFEINEKFEISHFGQKNCNTYIYFYIARSYEKLNDWKRAESYYKKAIKQSHFPVEANFYLGLLYKQLQKPQLAKKHLEQSLKFITQGYKQQDVYVELFDEVYPQQIEEALISFK